MNDLKAYLNACSKTIFGILLTACVAEDAHLNANHAKDVLKITLAIVQYAKRTDKSNGLIEAWAKEPWNTLPDKLASSPRFKTTTSLQSITRQIANITKSISSTENEVKGEENTKSKKRAADEEVTEKRKRKKSSKKPDPGDASS